MEADDERPLFDPGDIVCSENGDYAFRIIAEIGEGRCCVVFSGSSVRDGTTVALKFFKRGRNYEGALQREKYILEAFNNPSHNIVLCYGAFDFNGLHCHVMELLEGNLRQMIFKNERQGLSPWATQKFAKDIIRSLSWLHASGFVHADLKPANVMWSAVDGCFKLLDFGLTFHVDEAELHQIQSSGYRAPECSEWNRFQDDVRRRRRRRRLRGTFADLSGAEQTTSGGGASAAAAALTSFRDGLNSVGQSETDEPPIHGRPQREPPTGRAVTNGDRTSRQSPSDRASHKSLMELKEDEDEVRCVTPVIRNNAEKWPSESSGIYSQTSEFSPSAATSAAAAAAALVSRRPDAAAQQPTTAARDETLRDRDWHRRSGSGEHSDVVTKTAQKQQQPVRSKGVISTNSDCGLKRLSEIQTVATAIESLPQYSQQITNESLAQNPQVHLALKPQVAVTPEQMTCESLAQNHEPKSQEIEACIQHEAISGGERLIVKESRDPRSMNEAAISPKAIPNAPDSERKSQVLATSAELFSNESTPQVPRSRGDSNPSLSASTKPTLICVGGSTSSAAAAAALANTSPSAVEANLPRSCGASGGGGEPASPQEWRQGRARKPRPAACGGGGASKRHRTQTVTDDDGATGSLPASGPALPGTPADMWSFGCLLAECLTGHKLFHGGDKLASVLTPMQLLEMRLGETEVKCSEDEQYEYFVAAKDLISRCLSDDCSSRLSAAEAAAHRLMTLSLKPAVRDMLIMPSNVKLSNVLGDSSVAPDEHDLEEALREIREEAEKYGPLLECRAKDGHAYLEFEEEAWLVL